MRLLSGILISRVKLNLEIWKMYKSLPFKLVWNHGILNTINCSELPIFCPCTRDELQLSLCHLYKIIHNQCYFPPIFSARETRTHVNRSFWLTQPFTQSNSYFYSFVPNVTHCRIVYLNLLYVLSHSLFLNSSPLFLFVVYYKLLGAYLISFVFFYALTLYI